jgi:nucleotide-binding universal stress UspA family protein
VQLSLEAVVLFTEPRARQQQEHDWSRYFLLTVSTSSPLIESSRSTTHYESGRAQEVKKILKGAGMHLLNGQSYETNGVAFVGVKPDARGRRSRRMRTPPHEQAILKEIVELADQYDLKIKTAVRAGITPDDAILMEIKRNKHDLIVLGVSRRPGEKLFFGDTATAVFEKAPASILIVTT